MTRTVNSGDRITVKVPGSIANLGPDFDVFALALKAPHDLLTLELTDERDVCLHISAHGFEIVGLDSDTLLTSPGAGVKTVVPFAR